ncbi:hypothetical protein EVAR_91798_1 [Eumeta japonica]|uniref:Uncharacterized protein n=1 Tax=Eumeta variegata TaxID=151549 RepID=A0A4C1TK02_EUMVA|nr:hypothetical protein EVAR_91798_1 [Eumeta japonica]
MRRLHSERRLGRISYPHASHKLPRRSSPAQANFRSSFHSYRGPVCVDDVPVSDDRLVGALIDVSFSCSAVFARSCNTLAVHLQVQFFNLQSLTVPNSSYEVLETRICSIRGWKTGRVGVARSTVDMHRVRVRNRASVGATVARRAYSPPLSVHAYRRDKAIRRRDRTRQPVTTPQLVTPLESVKQCNTASCNGDFGYRRVSPHPDCLSSRCALLWSADFLQCGGVVNNGQRFLSFRLY